ncbi:oxygen-independent coproporphyrinogen III oxidase [Polymorphum gilvum]|uniref:Coproporphyrinogen-III oxidase n=1 Tax=Polymorphum gilvum (strain LMG 25793 / CGMCC 1.9160 / SL003B-26A1) TaxID=991905 RepID=F2IXL4_POLGS|nr:oxygen-independent coproporphyrinogen III oxidase [Polymorphum gilvum]ADZ71637.1 Oxygen-independent coproporphyrinogen III oxidase (Coproporphyrinogenase) (Coprogen oxidase) [Polymorphum gilvum SL003B-26A1]
MTKNALTYASRNVPRYTSYPTAPHFHGGIDGALYADWLRACPPETELSLYLHVPFCREICHYCGCHTKATRKDAPLIAYAKTLGREIELVAEKLGSARPVSHIHWGGGTPSLLPQESLLELAGLLRVSFALSPDLEHAIELDPRLVSPGLAATLAAIGVNRASLGVQDMDPVVQRAIGRVQPYDDVVRATDALRNAGITALNFDLMYGLPHQTSATILDTVARTLELAPSRIALFGYAHVPWMKKHQRLIDEAALPSPQLRLELAEIARSALLEAGYEAIGLDHFALSDDSMAIAQREGRLRRNFQGYTTDTATALIGLGVSSIGLLHQGYVQNASDVGAWERAIEAGRLPIVRGIAMDDDDRARADIIERLMTDYEADVAAIATAHGMQVSAFDESIAKLDDLVVDGLALVDGYRVRLTDAGRTYVRIAAAAFDAYLGKAAPTAVVPRHSMAV